MARIPLSVWGEERHRSIFVDHKKVQRLMWGSGLRPSPHTSSRQPATITNSTKSLPAMDMAAVASVATTHLHDKRI